MGHVGTAASAVRKGEAERNLSGEWKIRGKKPRERK
jgi:hypothetical protein